MTGQKGIAKPLPDVVVIHEPPQDKEVAEPTSDHRDQPAVLPPPVVDEPVYQQPEPGFDGQEFHEQPAF